MQPPASFWWTDGLRACWRWQGGKNPFKDVDMAKDRLFLGVSDDVWKRPTFVIFYNLLDNYERCDA